MTFAPSVPRNARICAATFWSDGDAVRLVLSFRNLRQVLLQFSVERCLKRRVREEFYSTR